MTIDELVTLFNAMLEIDDKARVAVGFDPEHPMSWRGDYRQLSFPPKFNVPVIEMRDALVNAIGQTFFGYKGGDYTMNKWTSVHIDEYSECNDPGISPALCTYWMHEVLVQKNLKNLTRPNVHVRMSDAQCTLNSILYTI